MPQVARLIDDRVFDVQHARRAAMIADAVVPIITMMAKAYTRDVGFDAAGVPNPEIASVIMAASARLGANTTQTAGSRTDSTGGDSSSQTARDQRTFFTGWSLAEQAVLNRYRKRAQ